MIKEAYCSFEVAKLLKEKGFDEPCLQIWECEQDKKYLFRLQSSCYQNITEEDSCLAPTHQMAMKWLREVRGLSVEIFSIKGTSNVCPVFWKGNVVKLLTQDRVFSGELVSSYEEAIEAALKYSLTNLI